MLFLSTLAFHNTIVNLLLLVLSDCIFLENSSLVSIGTHDKRLLTPALTSKVNKQGRKMYTTKASII